MFGYLSLAGFKLRTVMPDSDVQALETRYPGWIQQNLNMWESRINAQLRKRYGAEPGLSNVLPLGQNPPALESFGTNTPPLALLGRPVTGDQQLVVQITTPGALGTAVFRWSKDNGVTWTSGIASGALVALSGTGLALVMTPGPYAIDNVYAAASPVPETVLQWIVILTTWDAYQKRGRNPQDPLILDLKDDRLRALAEVKEAADSKDGLFDLPVSEDLDSAITTGGPLAYSEHDPYGWLDLQANARWQPGCNGRGGP